MKGLLLKDFYVILKQLKVFLIISFLLLLANSSQTIMFMTMFFAVIPMTALSYDEQSKWNELAIMMPYGNRSLVISKFLLGYISITTAVIIFVTVNVVTGLMGIRIIDWNSYINIIVMAVSGALIFLALNLVTIFKFGVEKGRLVFIFAMIIIGIGGSVFSEINVDLVIKIVPSMVFIVAILINLVSLPFAVKAYSKKNC